jgi:hypothetical protein
MSPINKPALLAVVLAAAAGCSKGTRVEDFTPPADNARKALEAALNHWQAGNPPGSVPGTRPAVEVIDAKWKAGQKLTGFEVVKEEPPAGTGPRYFTVRLTPAKGPPEEVRYVVLGIDPLWVYREDDYKKLSGAGM